MLHQVLPHWVVHTIVTTEELPAEDTRFEFTQSQTLKKIAQKMASDQLVYPVFKPETVAKTQLRHSALYCTNTYSV